MKGGKESGMGREKDRDEMREGERHIFSCVNSPIICLTAELSFLVSQLHEQLEKGVEVREF